MSNKVEKSSKEPDEIRVLEVRRTITEKKTNSEKFVFHLKDGDWKFHSAGAYDFGVEDLEAVIVQLKLLAGANPDKEE